MCVIEVTFMGTGYKSERRVREMGKSIGKVGRRAGRKASRQSGRQPGEQVEWQTAFSPTKRMEASRTSGKGRNCLLPI